MWPQINHVVHKWKWFILRMFDDTLLGINYILIEQDVILLSKVHKEIRIKIGETKQHMCMLVIAISRKWHKLFRNLATFWHTRFGLWSSAVTCLFHYCHCQTVIRLSVVACFCDVFLTYQERETYSAPCLTLNKDIYFTHTQYSIIIFLFQHSLSIIHIFSQLLFTTFLLEST